MSVQQLCGASALSLYVRIARWHALMELTFSTLETPVSQGKILTLIFSPPIFSFSTR